MLNHPTLDKLLALKLTGMAKALSEQMDLPESQALGFEERLGLLVDREMTVRSDRRLTTRLRQAKLRLSASLEDLDYRHPRGLDKASAAPPGLVPMGPRAAPCAHHGSHGHWQNLARVCLGSSGLS